MRSQAPGGAPHPARKAIPPRDIFSHHLVPAIVLRYQTKPVTRDGNPLILLGIGVPMPSSN